MVRGTTCHKIVKMLYDSGVKEVHVRIACPQILYPDYYGVDMPTKKVITYTTPFIVTEVSAILVENTTFLSYGPPSIFLYLSVCVA